MQNLICNDSTSILSQVLEEMKIERGDKFSLQNVNLAELERRTGISRSKLRRLKKLGFVNQPNAHTGCKASKTVLSGFTGILDDLLRNSVSNSSVCFDRLVDNGYTGSLTQVKEYILKHKDLIPAKRQTVSPQGNRGRRYTTGPGESYQMDWGFVNVESRYSPLTFQVACFAMICHHCGNMYIEFFPNAKQENLFIGMIHAFMYMGVPQTVLTDNMKSVVIRRDPEGHPIWQNDYESFMKVVGFNTKLCKPRHPFTKGKVERLVQYVKGNFIAGRTFINISDLNEEALIWCDRNNKKYHQSLDCFPSEVHSRECSQVAFPMEKTHEIAMYLCPIRSISFDGFINYEGRRFGIPYWYTNHLCRVNRDRDTLTIYDIDLKQILTKHQVTWSKHDSFCENQYLDAQPEEQPTMPVTAVIHQIEAPKEKSVFSKFNFDKEAD